MKTYQCLALAAVLLSLAGCSGQEEAPGLAEEGMTAVEKENYEGAVKNFNESIARNEDVLLSWRGLGMAYMGLEDYQEAVKAFDQALGLTDDKMQETKRDLLYYKAAALYRQGSYGETVQVCNELLQLSPEADAYYLRGACYLEQDEREKAGVDFDAAAAKAPRDYDLFLNIYETYRGKKLSADGDAYLQRALDIEPDAKEDYLQRARIYFALEDYESAKKELDTLVSEKDGEALLLMGRIYLKMEDYAHSRSMYQEYLDSRGKTPVAYNGIVLADLAEGDIPSALDHIAEGLELDGEEGKQELLFNEIVAYEKEGDFQTAKEKAAAYVEQYPQDAAGKKEYEFLKSR